MSPCSPPITSGALRATQKEWPRRRRRGHFSHWWAMRDLNPRPCPCKGPALPLRQSPVLLLRGAARTFYQGRIVGAPRRIRISVSALRGQRPWPLDDGGTHTLMAHTGAPSCATVYPLVNRQQASNAPPLLHEPPRNPTRLQQTVFMVGGHHTDIDDVQPAWQGRTREVFFMDRKTRRRGGSFCVRWLPRESASRTSRGSRKKGPLLHAEGPTDSLVPPREFESLLPP